jgi:hypothetical protein
MIIEEEPDTYDSIEYDSITYEPITYEPDTLEPNELAQRDLNLREIRENIQQKKAYLKRIMSTLKKEIGTNQELNTILSDYEESVSVLRTKKEEQVIYFELMQDYLDKITNDSDLTAEALIRAKDDQRSILEEMKKVKDELKELVEETSS